MNEEVMKATVVLETSADSSLSPSKFPLTSKFKTQGSHQVLWFFGSGFTCGCKDPCDAAVAPPGPCGPVIGATVSVDGERRKEASILASAEGVHLTFTPAVAVLQLEPGEHLLQVDLLQSTSATPADIFRVLVLDYGTPCRPGDER
jgi:hypothetical protein